MKHLRQICLALISLVLLSACGADSEAALLASEAWVRVPAAPDITAAYFTLQNSGAEEARLVSVSSDAAEQVEMHESMDRGGTMQMAPVPVIAVPAHGQTSLAPGGTHLMLIGLKRDLQAGDQVNLTLTFADGSTLTVTAVVRDQ